ncbi:outer membrane beta-barrel protein [Pedobacter rhodius]|uniref:TonB-dependent receptor n=1 Tax=Pedobacter rhodius TaxID=3004098 RepID=A0ABT4L0Q1_9SPHI|nr:outer membrane beta-barrel protein [Pedobacter sp. SJ11]MCZ4224027.1 TonB-dependent receptor [Pedobacter sp. SJ11]
MNFFKSLLLLFLLLSTITGFSQKKIKVIVLNEKNLPFESATVELLSAKNLSFVKAGRTDKKGIVIFNQPAPGNYIFNAKAVGYEAHKTTVVKSPFVISTLYIKILPGSQVLKEVVIGGTKPPIQHIQGKVVLNIDAIITNSGTTVLELLEKSPGVMIDKEGSISLQGKSNVLIMIDEKPTYLSGSDLTNLLSSMSSSQVSQIELMTNPSAKYDASGNGGIINIKTKKNTQEGFNGSVNIIGGWSRDYKNNNSLLLNYKKGKVNAYATTSYNANNNFTDIYADRDYFNQDNATTGILEQKTAISNLTNYSFLKTGIDIYASKTTTIGFSISGMVIKRTGKSDAVAMWKKESGSIDSSISTISTSLFKFNNRAANLNVKQNIGEKQELSVDLDALKYSINNNQEFINKLQATNGYTLGTDVDIPSTIKIFSVKADHTLHLNPGSQLESGFKSSSISTDNIADYVNLNGLSRSADLNRSNHFQYRENISALYTSFEHQSSKINAQIGLRYEHTNYDARQLGNSIKPDSSFSRTYGNLFPSGYLSYQADSLNAFTITASRRIDRPAYQKLNPFIFIVNKYTLQRGNPYIIPQYSWNLEFSHRYDQLITTTLSYSVVKNYFSQLFLSEGTNILIYTDGNVGEMSNLGLSVSLQFPVTKWWSFNGQGNYNYKKLDGYQNINYQSSINQFQISASNQFNIAKTVMAELSGFYITKARNDLQELLYPTGQVSAGVSKTILKGKGSLKFSARDLFFTQAMEGLTDFPQAQEYFKLTRDSRLFFLSFTYRFGKPLKAIKRSNGGVTDEMKRAGSIN